MSMIKKLAATAVALSLVTGPVMAASTSPAQRLGVGKAVRVGSPVANANKQDGGSGGVIIAILAAAAVAAGIYIAVDGGDDDDDSASS